MRTGAQHPCPSCGFVVFDEVPGSYELCLACDWEDDAVQLANPVSNGGANLKSLADAQLEALNAHPLGVRRMEGLTRDARFRPLSSAELEQYAAQVQEGGQWPNMATFTYYWNTAPLGFETVHTMLDFYDGPRAGVADYKGVPHYYASQWDDLNGDWLDTYLIWPIPEATFDLSLESWWIWLRWEAAFYAGATTQDTHPALPDERARYDELQEILSRRFPSVPTDHMSAGTRPETPPNAMRMRASFSSPPHPEGHFGWRGLAVKWTELTPRQTFGGT